MENQPSHFNLGEATDNVLQLKLNGAKALIALGDWITLVKENLPRTEWLDWLKYDVDIKLNYAYKLMQAAVAVNYRELEKLQPENLSISKIFEIMSLPEGDFKDELIEKAPILTVKEIRGVKEGFATSQKPIEGTPILELGTDIRDTLKLNADFLDALAQLSLDSIPANFLDLLENQLKMNIKEVAEFIKRIEYARSPK